MWGSTSDFIEFSPKQQKKTGLPVPPWLRQTTSQAGTNAQPENPEVEAEQKRLAAFQVVMQHRPDVFVPVMQKYLSDPLASREEVDLFVRHLGADLNSKTPSGTPFLLEALDRNHPRAFKWIIRQSGIQLDAKDRRGRTPLLAAVIRGHLPTVQALARQGLKVNLNGKEGERALEWAANRCDGRMLNYLLDWWGNHLAAGFREHWWDRIGRQHLTVEAFKRWSKPARPLCIRNEIQYHGRPRMIQAMHGANFALNEGDPGHDGFTPMHVAAKKGRLDVVRTLLLAGLEADRPASDGRTPLMEAALSGQSDIVKVLSDLGDDVNREDEAGETALIYVFRNPNGLSFEPCKAIVEHLLRKGADVNHQNKNGVSALHLAADLCKGDVRLVHQLLEAGANIHAQDANHFSPLDYARGAKDPARNRAVIELLKEKSQAGGSSAP